MSYDKNPGEIVYRVNEEFRTVVAYFYGGRAYWVHSFLRIMEKILPGSSTRIMDSGVLQAQDYFMNVSSGIAGIARCHPEDTWDAETGKKIARKRLLTKLDKFLKHLLKGERMKFANFARDTASRFLLQESRVAKRIRYHEAN